MRPSSVLLLIIAAVFGYIRFTLPATHLSFSGSYQAAAHLFVGGLFGAWMATKDDYMTPLNDAVHRQFYLLLAIGMTVLEVVATTVTRL